MKPNRTGPGRVTACYYCICNACNLKNCISKTHWARCLKCMQRGGKPTVDCDDFTPQYVAHVYRKIRVQKRGPDRLDLILKKLDELLGR